MNICSVVLQIISEYSAAISVYKICPERAASELNEENGKAKWVGNLDDKMRSINMIEKRHHNKIECFEIMVF